MKQTIYAAIGIEDDESIVAFGPSPEEMRPLCFMDEKLLPSALSAAKRFSEATGKQIVVGKFELQEVIERFDGK
jgi:hypothetical protein